VLTAGFDPLRDEGEAYADRLDDAGVPITYTEYEGQIHGFLLFPGVVNAVEDAVAELADGFRDALG
jgi:acetyl esterase